MKKTIAAVLGVFIFCASVAAGQREVENFIQYNPDGEKYEFVKTYIMSLGYWHSIEKSHEKTRDMAADEPEGRRVRIIMENLTLDNVNVRIARNLLSKYENSENGLILKVTKLYTKICNEQVALNNKELAVLADLQQINEDEAGDDKRDQLKKDQERIARERKESLKGLLEASLLVGKILVSNKPDRHGDFITLGITDKQRQKLLFKLNEFEGEEFEGALREGQSPLQASVSAIRAVLEDYSWDTLGS